MRPKKTIQHVVFVICLTILYAFSFLLIDFIDTPTDGIADFFEITLKWGFFVAATFLLLYFLSVNKYLFCIVFPLLTLSCTALSYFKLTLHVQLTQMVLDLAVVNDFRTTMEAFSWQLVVVLLLSVFVSIWIVIYRFKYVSIRYEWTQLALSGLVLAGVNTPVSISLALSRHTPYSIYYSIKGYFDNRRTIEEVRPEFTEKSVCNSDSLTVVFVLGESLSAKNMQINGYQRATTPYICREKNLVSYTDIYSEYEYTHTSVPYILTRADHQHPDLGYEERSFISIMKQAGFHTTWLANQESIGTYTYFMNECDSLVYISNGKSLFIFSKWLDEDILPHYRRILQLPSKRNFLLVHTVGSHWYYNNHYPDSFTRYKPITKSKVISSNTHEEMINSYDNTIVYSDYIWHRLIEELRDRKAVLVYLSDHAENLGEDGHYTHGDGDWPAQHYPGCFVWYSDKYLAAYPQKIEALKRHKDERYNSSFLFHSILSAADIESKYIHQSENIFQ